jgi:aromatic ring hydroxylase
MTNGAGKAQSKSPFLELLRQIDAGVVIYAPFDRTPDRAREFSDTAARLEEMERLGLVRLLFTQSRSSFGEEQVTMVMVVGGLTEEGKRLLSMKSSEYLS